MSVSKDTKRKINNINKEHVFFEKQKKIIRYLDVGEFRYPFKFVLPNDIASTVYIGSDPFTSTQYKIIAVAGISTDFWNFGFNGFLK